jgi:hypothetical protein
MPRFRAGAYDKGSKTKGKFYVVEATTEAAAMLEIRHRFREVPLGRMFATPAEHTDKVDGTLHTFKPANTRGSQ